MSSEEMPRTNVLGNVYVAGAARSRKLWERLSFTIIRFRPKTRYGLMSELKKRWLGADQNLVCQWRRNDLEVTIQAKCKPACKVVKRPQRRWLANSTIHQLDPNVLGFTTAIVEILLVQSYPYPWYTPQTTSQTFSSCSAVHKMLLPSRLPDLPIHHQQISGLVSRPLHSETIGTVRCKT